MLCFSFIFVFGEEGKEDKTEKVNALLEQAKFEMAQASKFISQNTKPAGPCPCYYKGRSSHCTAFKYINPDVPEYSVHDLNRIGNSKALLRELIDAEILTVDKRFDLWRAEDLPADARKILEECYPKVKQLEKEILTLIDVSPADVAFLA